MSIPFCLAVYPLDGCVLDNVSQIDLKSAAAAICIALKE